MCIERFGINLHVSIGKSIKGILLRGCIGRIGKSSDSGARLLGLEFDFPDFRYLTLGKLLYLCVLQHHI